MSLLSSLSPPAGVGGKEFGKALRCFAFLFFLMAAYYIVKPVRDALALEFDTDKLPYFYLVVTFAVLVANMVYDRIARVLPRRRFFVGAHIAYAAVFLCFAAMLAMTAPPQGAPGLAAPALEIASPRGIAVVLFFLWVSVYILFAATMFWSFVNDIHDADQGKRLFGYIGAAGPAGALAGSFATGGLLDALGIAGLLLTAVAMVGISFAAMRSAERYAERPPDGEATAARLDAPSDGLGSVHGFALVARHRYLLLLTVAMLLFTFNATFFSLRYADIVKEALPDTQERTRLFAANNQWINIAGIMIQLLITRFVLTRFGLLAGLLALPLCDAFGFLVYHGGAGLAAATGIWVAQRALSYSIDRAAKEVLYTPAPRSFKYLGKAVIETLVFRLGDALAALYFIVESRAGTPGWVIYALSAVAIALRCGVAAALARRMKSGRIVDRPD